MQLREKTQGAHRPTKAYVFTVVGPLGRGVTQLMLLWLPMRRPTAVLLHRCSRSIGAYYALEVMLLAIPLINMAFAPITAELLTPGQGVRRPALPRPSFHFPFI